MIYYSDENIVIRTLREEDIPIFTAEERAQGWDASDEKLKMRLRHMAEGICIPLMAELGGEPAGYINVYPDCKWGALGGKGYPEIIDFAVLEKFRRRGVGTALMDAAEKLAAEYADTVYLEVGLHSGYGSAQRMYVKRGYIPDGSGVWYGGKPCVPYTDCKNDDELNLCFYKKTERRMTMEPTAINTAQEVYEVDKLTILDCGKLHIQKEKSGYLTVEYDSRTYHKVNPTRLTPFYSKTTYISLSYENDEKEFREIGVIRDMKELSEEQYKLLDSYLEYKYYMPEITKVYSIKDNMRGAIFVKADTTSGQKTICIRDWYQNFRMLTYDYLYVCDADGNKYFCPDINKLDKKSRQVLEMFT